MAIEKSRDHPRTAVATAIVMDVRLHCPPQTLGVRTLGFRGYKEPFGPILKGHLQVSGFTLMEKSDVKHLAPLWLKYSEDVRFDDMVRQSRCRAPAPSPSHIAARRICCVSDAM